MLRPSFTGRSRALVAHAILLAVVFVALVLRLYGLNWDQGYLFHPDERMILMVVEGRLSLPLPPNLDNLLDANASTLNPHFFAYGSLPLYLLKMVSYGLSFIQKSFASHDLRFVGRAISAIFDTGTVLLVFFIARRLYGTRVALLASTFVALGVIHIQLSHFYTVDVILTFFIVATFYYCVRVASQPSLRLSALLGLCLGFGLATKVSIFPLVGTVLVAYGFQIQHTRSKTGDLAKALNEAFMGIGVAGFVAAVAFIVTSPYALLDNKVFMESVIEQSEMVRRIRDFPYTRQYVDTPAYWYHIDQIVRWGLGYPVGLIAWVGVLFTTIFALMKRRPAEVLLLAWFVPYFFVTGGFEVKFLRYMLPVIPFMCIMGSSVLISLRDWSAKRMRIRQEAEGPSGPMWATVRIPSQFDERTYAVAKGPFSGDRSFSLRGPREILEKVFYLLVRPRTVDVFLVLAISYSLFYSVSYVNLYSVQHTAVQASEWINKNVPKGTTILQEHWEEGIPNLPEYRRDELPMYDGDDSYKLNKMANQLERSDYVVFYSNRLYGTVTRLPERYPMSARYYELLFSGQLGFELVYYSTSYPNIAGISFVDDTFDRVGLPVPTPLKYYSPSRITIPNGFADESFTVYDHPKVMIFKKTAEFSSNTTAALLNDALLTRGGKAIAQKEGLLLSASDLQAAREGGTWSQIFDRNGLTNHFPLLSWLVTVELIALLTLPIGFLLFAGFVDRGYLLSKTLGILLTAYIAWMASSLHFVTYSRLSILGAIALIALASGICFALRKGAMISFVREKWKLILTAEAVFLVAFLLFYAIRLMNPDLWHPYRGGEKPMDVAYLNAVVRTTYFPPYDPWFSGGFMNYYYFGQVIVATLIKLTGISTEISFNLALPLLFALTFAGVFSVAQSLVGYRLGQEKGEKDAKGTSLLSMVMSGLAAAFMVAVLGNLDGLFQILEGLWSANPQRFESNIPGLAGAVNAVTGVWQVVVGHRIIPQFDFWRSSRMMPPSNSITEFPFFTFLFADLHAHLISLPFAVLALGLISQLVFGIRVACGKLDNHIQRSDGGKWREITARAIPFDSLAIIAALSLVVGALRLINSWDYPTYLILAAAVVFLREFLSEGRLTVFTIVRSLLGVAAIYLLSFLLFLPFHRTYELFYTGILLSKETTPLSQYLSIHGLFLFLSISFIITEWVRRFRKAGFIRFTLIFLRRFERVNRAIHLRSRLVKKSDPYSYLLPYLMLALAGAIFIGTMARYQTVAFLFFLLAAIPPIAIEEIVRKRPGFVSNVFVFMLIGLAAGLGIGVDLITIQGDIDRMNTVFKFYLQIWVLYGIVSAYSLWWVSRTLLDSINLKRTPTLPDSSTRRSTWQAWKLRLVTSWFGVLAVLLFSTSIYPALATPVRVKDRFGTSPLTNNGADFMNYSAYNENNGKIDLVWDYEGIRWLQENVQGTPIILEGVTPLYRWGSRFSVHTGLPTVIGWDWHQKQQRWGYAWMIDSRFSDVKLTYTTPDPVVAISMIKKYNVEYVIVGKLERLYYPEAGIVKFEAMVGQYLEPVYRNQELTIYQVKP